MAIVPVALTNGTNWTISGAGSNIATKDSSGTAWCFSDDSYTVNSAVLYKINGTLKYTSAIESGTVYASLSYSSGSDAAGNVITVTYDNTANILIFTLGQNSIAGDGNAYVGFNDDKNAPTDQATGTFYLDNQNYQAIRESGTDEQSLSGNPAEDDELTCNLGEAPSPAIKLASPQIPEPKNIINSGIIS